MVQKNCFVLLWPFFIEDLFSIFSSTCGSYTLTLDRYPYRYRLTVLVLGDLGGNGVGGILEEIRDTQVSSLWKRIGSL